METPEPEPSTVDAIALRARELMVEWQATRATKARTLKLPERQADRLWDWSRQKMPLDEQEAHEAKCRAAGVHPVEGGQMFGMVVTVGGVDDIEVEGGR